MGVDWVLTVAIVSPDTELPLCTRDQISQCHRQLFNRVIMRSYSYKRNLALQRSESGQEVFLQRSHLRESYLSDSSISQATKDRVVPSFLPNAA